ncbi:DUF3823 domain-containing protein [Mucilaginibacter endophyticus]|uniref:DUF3823 domain-containing protein n=1 Tax=Mucilaginibacter endophyticus TaxID=2675003 RepID=UPI000E0D93EC|nr:DUF3823 domain-containing protein [Mucilaginibacter endophyticus]
MKIKFHHILIGLFLAASGCKKDNYDAPTSRLSGRLVYKGEAINVEYNAVPYQIYQPGFATKSAIQGTFDPDGNYAQLLFDGTYKFTIPANQGPFMWKELPAGTRDSLTVNLKGSQTVDIEVTPYYLVQNAKFAATGRKVTATFDIQKVITDANAKNIDHVYLYVNKTQFVSGGYRLGDGDPPSIAGSAITGMNNLSLSFDVPNIVPTQNYVFARVGLKIAGVEDLIFSPVSKVTLQ